MIEVLCMLLAVAVTVQALDGFLIKRRIRAMENSFLAAAESLGVPFHE